MRFLRAIGLVAEPKLEDVTDEQKDVIIAAFEQALLCGMVVTPDFYLELGDLERACLRVANERAEVHKATLVGLASQGAGGLADVLARVDGGEARKALERLEQEKEVRRKMLAAARKASPIGGTESSA